MSAQGTVRLQRRGEVSLLVIDNPPVNALSVDVIEQLGAAVDAFGQDSESRALIIGCAGRSFVAGGDIAEFDDPAFSAAPLNRILARIEQMDRPVVATMHGFAFGGGLELALACHHRIATRDAQFAFPEVKLGLLPGSLGTQRLPRLVGAELALDLISTGRRMDTSAALECGLIDAIVDGDPLERGIRFALELPALRHRSASHERAVGGHRPSPAGLLRRRSRARPPRVRRVPGGRRDRRCSRGGRVAVR